MLFVPLYLLYAQENNFWPFFPLGHPRGDYDWGWPGIGRSLYEYVMQLFVRRHNWDIFRVSADWIFIVSSLILASRLVPGWRTAAVRLAGLAYAALLVFMAYSGFVHYVFDRPGTLLDDVLMLESAWILVRDTWGWMDVLSTLVLLAAVAGLGVLANRYLQAAWRWGSGFEPRRLAAGWLLLNAYCLLSLSWFGVLRDDPVIQLQTKHLYYNWQRSQDVLATVEALRGSVVDDAVRLDQTEPQRRPDIYLFSVESYGATLWADEDYRAAREGLMRRVQSELDALGLPIFTRFATSPVYGGGSWMSTASALSGIRIGNHSTYWAWKRMSDRYPHLIAYLKRHGYYTLSVQPGATWTEDLYGYDEVIIREDFSYDGLAYGFGHVPRSVGSRIRVHEPLEPASPSPPVSLLGRLHALCLGPAAPHCRRHRGTGEAATFLSRDPAGLCRTRAVGSPGSETRLLRYRCLRVGTVARCVPESDRTRIHRARVRRSPTAIHHRRAGWTTMLPCMS